MGEAPGRAVSAVRWRHVYGQAALGLLAVTLPLERSARDGAPFPVPDRVLHEGVPDHLEPALRKWIYSAFAGGGAELIALQLEIPIYYDRCNGDAALFLAQAQTYDMLRVVNAILANGGPWPAPLVTDRPGRNTNQLGRPQLREGLRRVLAAASSAWEVDDDGNGL